MENIWTKNKENQRKKKISSSQPRRNRTRKSPKVWNFNQLKVETEINKYQSYRAPPQCICKLFKSALTIPNGQLMIPETNKEKARKTYNRVRGGFLFAHDPRNTSVLSHSHLCCPFSICFTRSTNCPLNRAILIFYLNKTIILRFNL